MCTSALAHSSPFHPWQNCRHLGVCCVLRYIITPSDYTSTLAPTDPFTSTIRYFSEMASLENHFKEGHFDHFHSSLEKRTYCIYLRLPRLLGPLWKDETHFSKNKTSFLPRYWVLWKILQILPFPTSFSRSFTHKTTLHMNKSLLRHLGLASGTGSDEGWWNDWLVGGFNPSEKVLVKLEIFPKWKFKKYLKPPPSWELFLAIQGLQN